MINRTSSQLLKLENLLRWSFFTFFNLWFSTLSPWLVPPDYDILSFQFFLSFLSTFIWNNSTFTIVRPFKLTRNRICIFKLQARRFCSFCRCDSVAPGYIAKSVRLWNCSTSPCPFFPSPPLLPRFSYSIQTATTIYLVCIRTKSEAESQCYERKRRFQ